MRLEFDVPDDSEAGELIRAYGVENGCPPSFAASILLQATLENRPHGLREPGSLERRKAEVRAKREAEAKAAKEAKAEKARQASEAKADDGGLQPPFVAATHAGTCAGCNARFDVGAAIVFQGRDRYGQDCCDAARKVAADKAPTAEVQATG